MKGLELSKEYYKSFGEPMLRERFPELFDKIAVGLCGSGSECFGFDDDIMIWSPVFAYSFPRRTS